jgi:FkbM family methyltransferase
VPVTPSARPSSPSLSRLWELLGQYTHGLLKLGFHPTITLALIHLDRIRRRGVKGHVSSPRSIAIRGYPHPIRLRAGTSDLFVAMQIFLKEEYRCVSEERGVEFIVDCGGNIGCSAIYLLNRYPNARLIAIEADEGNAKLCRENLAPYGERAKVLNAGIWPRDEDLKVESQCGDGLEWSFQVRPCREGESADIRAVSIHTLLRESPSGRIDLLKVDIEGAERELFSDPGAAAWLGRVRCLAIEIHNQECAAAFSRAIAPFGFRTMDSGELTIGRRELD